MSKVVNTFIVSKDGLLEIIELTQTMDVLGYGSNLRTKLGKYREKGIVALGIESPLFESDPIRKGAYHIFLYEENEGRFMWTSYNRALKVFPDTFKIFEIAKSLSFLM